MQKHRPFLAAAARLSAFLFPTLLAAGAVPAVAAECLRPEPADRPTIGLALGGGGARGYAHIGVLRFLEEMRIPIDYIAGTSMGSIVGAFTATGMSADEIRSVVETLEWDEMFRDEAEREDKPLRRKDDDRLGLFGPKLGVGRDSNVLPAGVLAGQRILFKFENLTSQRVQGQNFDRFPIPFRAVATDIATGEPVVLERGSLSNAMRASMAVPGVFDPVRRDDRLLVDGGLSLNLPVDVVRAMGADVVIAIDVGTPLMGSDDIRDVLSIIEQLTGLIVVQNTERQLDALGARDILIRPDLGAEIASSDFDAFPQAIPLGYEAALAQHAALQALALDEGSYAAWRRGLESCESGPPEMQFVELENHSRFSDEVLWPLIEIEAGDRLDLEQVESSIRRIYGLGFIRLAQYQVVERNGRQGIVIEVQQDARGTDYLETGLTITGGRRGTRIDLQAGYLVTDLDQRGSEMRVAARVGDDFGLLGDVYKYLDDRRRWILNPEASLSRRRLFLFDDGGFAAGESETDQADLRLRFGREFGNRAIAWLGVARYFGDVSPLVGLQFPTLDFDGGEWIAGLGYDNLDNLFLPGDGAFANLRYVRSSESLGADQAFEQVLVNGLLARSWGRHSALASLRYNTTLDNDAPIYALFTGGGFLNMSGFEPFELSGQHFGTAALGYRYQVAPSGILPGYVGGTLEYGNAARDRSDVFGDGFWNGSLYLAYDTPLGPLYLGWGWNEDRSGLFFLQLGAILGYEAIGRR